MSGLRGPAVGRKTLSALRPARGKVARFFLPRVLGRVVADVAALIGHIFTLVSDAEPDALRNIGSGCGLLQLPKTAAAYDAHRVSKAP